MNSFLNLFSNKNKDNKVSGKSLLKDTNKQDAKPLDSKTISKTNKTSKSASSIESAQALKSEKASNNKKREKQATAVKKTLNEIVEPITVQFFSNNKKIANDFFFTGKKGTRLTTSDLPDVPGYKLCEGQVIDAILSNTPKTIKLNYLENNVQYKLIPIDEKGVSLQHSAKTNSYVGKPGDLISPNKFMNVPGYKPFSGRSYTIPNKENSEVKIVYSAQPQTVSVFYQLENGFKLDEVTLHGKTGEEYSINAEERKFDGYELAKLPENLKGTYKVKTPDVFVLYRPVKSSITVTFMDKQGNQVHKPLTFEGRYKDNYSIKLPIIDGYKLFELDKDKLSGTYSKKPTRIVLTFERASASFNVHFWFDKSKKLKAKPDRLVSGRVGERYSVEFPQLEGYELETSSLEGVFKTTNEDVDVEYKRIKCSYRINICDQAGRQLSQSNDLLVKGLWNETIDIQLPEILGYTKPQEKVTVRLKNSQSAQTVFYTAQDTKVNVKFINKRTGKEILATTSVTGLIGTAYNIEPKIIEGFKLQGLPENASGVFSLNMNDVEFMYEPNKSEILVHTLDTSMHQISPKKVITGFYGETYNIEPEKLAGYQFDDATADLSGSFPAFRQDIELYYKPDIVKFTIVPVNQYKNPINLKYNMTVQGLVNQHFSLALPDIPGYIKPDSEARGDIKPSYMDKEMKLPYQPTTQSIILHFIYSGGTHDGEHPFNDFELTGLTSDNYNYEVPQIEGYSSNVSELKGTFMAGMQELTIQYLVNKEKYQIQFIDGNGQLVGGIPEKEGFYDESVSLGNYVPKGFHLPDEASGYITLKGKHVYQVEVIPDTLFLELVTQALDGTELGSNRQLTGFYHENTVVDAPNIPGYEPINGPSVELTFDLDKTTVPVVYRPQKRSILVRYISTQGDSLRDPEEVEGVYQSEYHIKAPQIPGYVVVDDIEKYGTFGLQNSETAFIYRAGSDSLSKAIVPFEDMIDSDIEDIQSNVVQPAEPINNDEGTIDLVSQLYGNKE